MNIRVGVIGPEDSLSLIREVAEEFEAEVDITEIPYGDFEQLEDLPAAAADMDVLLYSGQAPYFWVKANLDMEKPSVYIPRSGSCLYKALFDVYREGIDVSSLSFDTICRRDIVETYRELMLPLSQVNTIDYPRYLPYDEIIEYHYNLVKRGETSAAMTCLTKSYEELKKLKVPCYRVYPTRSMIRRVLGEALLYGESAKLKAGQMALILVRVEDIEDDLHNGTSHQLQSLLLELHQILLDYGDENQSAVIRTGDSEFMLVTTVGSLEESTNSSLGSPLLRTIKSNSPLKVTVGVGLGRTGKMAEANGRQALRLSKSHSGDCYFVVTDKGGVLGPLKLQGSDHNQDTWDHGLEKMAKRLQMSVMNLNKVKAALRNANKSEITPQELSIYMNISERSARRILSQLEKKGVAKVVGNRSLSNKGRPRLVYKVLL